MIYCHHEHNQSHPLGEGWCCCLGIRGAGIQREAIALTQAEAARMVAEIVASELGWKK